MEPLESHLQYREEADWYVCDDVPTFTVFEIFDEARIKTIIENNNKRIANTGDLCPLVPGHNKLLFPKPAEDEVPILGFADNFRLGVFGEVEPLACIYSRWRIYKDKIETARNLPRRSVEFQDPDDAKLTYIDPIALLSYSTPRRDLGLLFSKTNDETINNFNMEGTMEVNEELKNLIADMIESSEVGAWCRSQMTKDGTETGTMEKDKMMDEDHPKEKVEEGYESEYSRKAVDEATRKFARAEEQNKVLMARLEVIEKKARNSEREKDLMQVEAEGICFSFVEELKDVCDMTDSDFAKHLKRMRQSYSKSPASMSRIPTLSIPEHGLRETNLATASYEEVLKAADLVIGGKAKDSVEALRMVKGGI